VRMDGSGAIRPEDWVLCTCPFHAKDGVNDALAHRRLHIRRRAT
jgi:hypothetical protein